MVNNPCRGAYSTGAYLPYGRNIQPVVRRLPPAGTNAKGQYLESEGSERGEAPASR